MTLVRYVGSAEINSFEFTAVLNHVISKQVKFNGTDVSLHSELCGWMPDDESSRTVSCFPPSIFRITRDLHFKTNLPILFHKLKIMKYEAYRCMCNTYLFIVTM
jgi:hypothetical protein